MQDLTEFYAGPVALALLLVMLGASELGFIQGKKRPVEERSFSMLGVLQGAMLGTLALLLGFTFSLAAERYDLRRSLMIEESNRIGTTYLRTTLLTPESGAEMRKLLKVYLDLRLERVHLSSGDVQFTELTRRTLKTQVAMWRIASKEGREYPNDSTALLIDALNRTIDISQEQFAARKNRVPMSGMVLLSVTAILSALILGFGFGIGRKRLFGVSLTFCAMVAAVIYTIIDFDRPNRGFVRVPDEMLRTLHAEMTQALQREEQRKAH